MNPHSEGAGYRPGSAEKSWILLPVVICIIRIIACLSVSAISPEGVWPSLILTPDSYGYITFSQSVLTPDHDVVPVREPTYPAILALTELAGDSSWVIVICLQQAADLATALMVGLLAGSVRKRWRGPAALMYILLPPAWIHSLLVLPDAFMTVTCAASGVLWLSSIHAESSRSALLLHAATGVVLSIGALFKPVLLPAPVIYIFLSLLRLKNRHSIGKAAAGLAVLIASFLALPLALVAYNQSTYGMAAVSSQGSWELMGRVGIMSGEIDPPGNLWEFTDSVNVIWHSLEPGSFAQRDSLYRSITVRSFLRAPLKVILPHLYSWPMFFKPGVSYFEDLPLFAEDGNLFLPFKAGITMLTFLFGFLAILSLVDVRYRRLDCDTFSLALCWFVYTVLIAGPLAENPRYGLTMFWALVPGVLFEISRLMEHFPLQHPPSHGSP